MLYLLDLLTANKIASVLPQTDCLAPALIVRHWTEAALLQLKWHFDVKTILTNGFTGGSGISSVALSVFIVLNQLKRMAFTKMNSTK